MVVLREAWQVVHVYCGVALLYCSTPPARTFYFVLEWWTEACYIHHYSTWQLL